MPLDDPRNDQELIAALNDGDVSAFDGLYYRYRDRVARLALRFTGNHADAMDVLQETFAYLFGKFPGFHLTASMTTFLYPVVRNLSLAARRKRRPTESTETIEEMAGFEIADPALEREELALAMRNLPAHQRQTLLLRFVDALSVDEIAAAMDVPAGTVKSRLHNALETLRSDPAAKRFFGE